VKAVAAAVALVRRRRRLMPELDEAGWVSSFVSFGKTAGDSPEMMRVFAFERLEWIAADHAA
jgi:hypothetical protein